MIQYTAQACFFILSMVLLSCSSGQEEATTTNTEVDQLKQELTEMHDHAMSQVQQMMELKQKMESELDTTDQSVTKAIQDMESADHAMMEWMHQSQFLQNSKTEADSGKEEPAMVADQIRGLKRSKVDLQVIEDQLSEAINKANSLVE